MLFADKIKAFAVKSRGHLLIIISEFRFAFIKNLNIR